MYCNVYDFGTILWGKFCCTNLFSKEPKNLAIEESAILVGMFKIQVYTSVRNPVGVKKQRNVVLAQMAKGNIITEKEKKRDWFTNYS
jgi:penicillin-binding protein 1A